jgi:uncharacterized membrane protein
MEIIKNPTNLILGLLLALVFALDICTTQIAVSSGLGYEANPILRAVVGNPLLIIVVKGIALLLTIYIVNEFRKHYPEWVGHFGMSVVIGITLGAVINNLLVIL